MIPKLDQKVKVSGPYPVLKSRLPRKKYPRRTKIKDNPRIAEV